MPCSTIIPPPSEEIVKACRCGRLHTGHDWLNLPYVGLMDSCDDYTMLQLRNCPCGSTLALVVPICVDPYVGLSSNMGLQQLLGAAACFKSATEHPAPLLAMEGKNG